MNGATPLMAGPLRVVATAMVLSAVTVMMSPTPKRPVQELLTELVDMAAEVTGN